MRRLIFIFLLSLPFCFSIDSDIWEQFDSDTTYLAINGQKMMKVGFVNPALPDGHPLYSWSLTTQSWIPEDSTGVGIQVALRSNLAYHIKKDQRVAYKFYSNVSWTSSVSKSMDLKVGANDDIFGTLDFDIGSNYLIVKWSDFLQGGVPNNELGVRVGVTSTGKLWYIKADGSIFKQVGGTWNIIPGKTARDIIIGSDDVPYIVSQTPTDGGYTIEKWNDTNNAWEVLPGIGGVSLALDSANNPYVVTDQNKVFRKRGLISNFCPACISGCSGCTDFWGCDSCNRTLCLPGNQCMGCETGTYPSPSTNTCEACSSTCKTCNGRDACSECASNSDYFYPDQTCQPTCDFPMMISPIPPWHCYEPCNGTNHFYYPDENVCKPSCDSPNTVQVLTYYKICKKPPPPTTPSTDGILTGIQTSANAATHISNAISSGSIRGVSAGIAGKIFTYIKFMNITYSSELENALQTWRSDILPFETGIKLSEKMFDDLSDQDVPYNFAKRDTPASFLLNYFDDMMFFSIVLTIFLFVWGMNKIALKVKSKYLPPSITRKLSIMVQNYLLTQLFSAFGDIIFFSALDLKSIELDNGISIIAFLAIIFLNLFMIITFIVYFWILFKYQKIKGSRVLLKKFLKYHEGHQLFYNDFKDSSLFEQSVLFIMVAKDILFSLIITILCEYPLVQVVLALILGLLMLAYYVFNKPFTSTFEATQQIIYEIIILIVTISVMILAILDDNNSIAMMSRNNIGKVIIGFNFFFNFIAFVFLLVKIGEVLLDAYKNYRARSKTHVEGIKSKSIEENPNPNLFDSSKDALFETSATKRNHANLNEQSRAPRYNASILIKSRKNNFPQNKLTSNFENHNDNENNFIYLPQVQTSEFQTIHFNHPNHNHKIPSQVQTNRLRKSDDNNVDYVIDARTQEKTVIPRKLQKPTHSPIFYKEYRSKPNYSMIREVNWRGEIRDNLPN